MAPSARTDSAGAAGADLGSGPGRGRRGAEPRQGAPSPRGRHVPVRPRRVGEAFLLRQRPLRPIRVQIWDVLFSK